MSGYSRTVPLPVAEPQRRASLSDGDVYGTLRRLFCAWDTDGDGALSRAEIGRVVRFATSTKLAEENLDKLMQGADRDGDGLVGYDDFVYWIYDFRENKFSMDFQPSRISASTSPIARTALQNWFNKMDMNRSGTLEYSEFAVSCFMMDSHADPMAIEEDFEWMDIRRAGRVTFPDFLKRYGQLLDAIPRPLEEKVQMVTSRAAALSENLECALGNGGFHLITGVEELSDLLRTFFSEPISKGLRALLDEDADRMLSIAELLSCLERLLDLQQGTRIDLRCLRIVCHQMGLGQTSNMKLSELAAAAQSHQTPNHRIRNEQRCLRKGSKEVVDLRRGSTGNVDAPLPYPRRKESVDSRQCSTGSADAPFPTPRRKGTKESVDSRQGSTSSVDAPFPTPRRKESVDSCQSSTGSADAPFPAPLSQLSPLRKGTTESVFSPQISTGADALFPAPQKKGTKESVFPPQISTGSADAPFPATQRKGTKESVFPLQISTASADAPLPATQRKGTKESVFPPQISTGSADAPFPTPRSRGSNDDVFSRQFSTSSALRCTPGRKGTKESGCSQQGFTGGADAPVSTPRGRGSKESVDSRQGSTGSAGALHPGPSNWAELVRLPLPQLACPAAVDRSPGRPSSQGPDRNHHAGTPSSLPQVADQPEAKIERAPRKPSLPKMAFMRRGFRRAGN